MCCDKLSPGQNYKVAGRWAGPAAQALHATSDRVFEFIRLMPLLETLGSGSGRTRLLLHTVCGPPTQGQVWGEALLRSSAVARMLQALRYQASHAWPLPITDIGCKSAGSYTCRLMQWRPAPA